METTRRSSSRLQEAGYYTEEGTPVISYRERLSRIFRRRMRPRRDRTAPERNSVRSDEVSGTSEIRNTSCNVSVKNVLFYIIFLIMAFTVAQNTFYIMKLQQDQLEQHNDRCLPQADTIANYALESQGARVLQDLSSYTYRPRLSTGSLWCTNRHLLYSSETHSRVIEGHSLLHAGHAWCFSGHRGHIAISLSHTVSITQVTLGHITKSQSPYGHIASAPRKISIYGMRTTEDKGTLLGDAVYDKDGAAFQTFRMSNEVDSVFRYVKLQVESNWGNIDYTCLYSFRVHGKLP